MNPIDNKPRNTSAPSARGSLILLTFGLLVLAFLVAIDRPHWFTVKPATGTAAAMSYAGQAPDRS
ncbi:hypothetical protein SAMN05192583_1969 [Sphingomonas gellani]|uniref:Uncharacterized protein n=1 Tax=Sphingomonas gellani TaxID=1166340 RepID=A0A1H8DL46_9SPHN|nr:hypothetical protein [Sphingomonas gellani]SEN07953.1 hypothetical protein SAMN05192583_1969 [Sphingomonas gellani]